MKRFEYQHIYLEAEDSSEHARAPFVALLNDAGLQGWRVIDMHSGWLQPGNRRWRGAYMEREKAPA
jgi:hypothetical protein